MSYAIFTIFYGLPLMPKEGRGKQLRKFVDRDGEGVHTTYSGSASDSPAAFGVSIGGFTECCHHVEASRLPMVATDQQKAQYQALFDALTPQEQALLKDLGEARVFFLVGTS